MLNDSQKQVFQPLAENRALFEALKEFLLEKFSVSTIKDEGTNEHLGMLTRSKLEGAKTIEQAFTEIHACKSQESRPELINPAL